MGDDIVQERFEDEFPSAQPQPEASPDAEATEPKRARKKTQKKQKGKWEDVEISTLLDAYVKYKPKLQHGNSIGFYSSITSFLQVTVPSNERKSIKEVKEKLKNLK